jgi:hypothetical protein
MGREAYGSLLRFVGHMAQAQFLDCHVADKFGSWRPSDTWNPSCFAEGAHKSWNSSSTEDRRVGEDKARSALQSTIFYTPSKWAEIGRLWRFDLNRTEELATFPVLQTSSPDAVSLGAEAGFLFVRRQLAPTQNWREASFSIASDSQVFRILGVQSQPTS